MAGIIIFGGLIGILWLGNKINDNLINPVADLEKRRNEIIHWTTQYAAEKISVNEIKFSSDSIDELLNIVCDNGYLNTPITEDIYKKIYIILVEKKIKEGEAEADKLN
jgi:hypothetical protein